MIEIKDHNPPGNSSNKKEGTELSVHPLFVTGSPEINALLGKVKKFARSDAPVLITGESGVGKEIIARLIHAYSSRKEGPFLAINSCAIPSELFESELFGHEKGAFTGAASVKEGCFEQADQGTLFLDEIGDMPKSLQVKVLRAVEQKTFRRIGGKFEVSVDVRIVSATNKILMEKVEDKSFREDLYHRLNVLELYIPPLRQRKKDIPVLLDHFLEIFRKRYDRPEIKFSDECIEILKRYSWPGNVRELRNIVERSIIITTGSLIGPSSLPVNYVKEVHSDSTPTKDFYQVPMGATMEEIEQAIILQTLAEVGNNKTKAARILGFTRKTLNSKIGK